MLARIRKSAENKDSGFTLIELLVVMIIIGILAAIAIPAFLNQKNKAKATSAKADVSTIGKEVAAFYVDGTGTLEVVSSGNTWTLQTPGDAGVDGIAGNADDTLAGPFASGKLSAGNAASGEATNDSTYCVQVVNNDAGTTDGMSWTYSVNGLAKGTCTGDAVTP